MAKIPFDIKFKTQIESGEYKVEDGFGREVRIVCWDAIIDSLEEKNIYGLAGLVKGKSGYENVALYQQDGVCFTEQGRWNLFLITPEPELSEFEKRLSDIVGYAISLSVAEPQKPTSEFVKEYAAELLELAKKELEPEVLERLEVAYKNQDEVVYENGKRDGKAETLRDLPMWRPAAKAYEGDRLPRIDWALNRLVARFEEGIYYLDIKELYNLPNCLEENLPR